YRLAAPPSRWAMVTVHVVGPLLPSKGWPPSPSGSSASGAFPKALQSLQADLGQADTPVLQVTAEGGLVFHRPASGLSHSRCVRRLHVGRHLACSPKGGSQALFPEGS
ncbi:hypothetical protein ABPG75_004128, partial [Micractinium tetrahymenae]